METARTVLHLCAWAQLGVITRIYLGRLLGGACTDQGPWHWIPCITSPGKLRRS